MCGIAGIYSSTKKVENTWIKKMTSARTHRGPDDEGFLAVTKETNECYHLTGSDSKVSGPKIYSFNKAAKLFLGHRRLSILDPTPLGHQPMSNRDGSIWIIHNGEIYNYQELREVLKNIGYQFRSNTDTEVLLTAYEELGEKCLSKLNGMWSFVIYDTKKNILFGARDRFGVKPLYYYIDQNYFAFASEIKALIKLPFIKKEINPKAVFCYLVLNKNDHEEEGFFKNIFEFQPSFAFYYCFSTNTIKKWRYYSLDYIDEWETFNAKRFENYADRTRQLVSNAISLRIRSDVPVGSCLSGGLDSSTIVCFINDILKKENIKQIGEKQKVFTASYDGNSIDESKWAKIVVDNTKTAWNRTFPRSHEFIEDLEDFVYIQDIPFGGTSVYAQYRVMKLARENGIKVLLDGQGGDELFTGYQTYYKVFFIEMLKALAMKDIMRELGNLKNSPIKIDALFLSVSKLLTSLLAPNMHRLRAFLLRMRRAENNYLNTDFWNENSKRLQMAKSQPITCLNEMLNLYISGPKLKSLLRYEDRNSMRFSIEARTPFADDIELIEYVSKIPSVYKIHCGWSKYLMRAVTKGILHEEIRLRKDKIGFATPEYNWLNENKEVFRSYITNDLGEFFKVDKIRRDWNILTKRQSKSDITSLWKFINLAIWRKVYAL